MQSTFQTRPRLPLGVERLFDQWGDLHGRIERRLFAAYCASGFDAKQIDALKPRVCAKFGITARQFNAIWMLLKGKIASKIAVDKLALADIKADLKAVRASLRKLEKQKASLTARQRKAWASKKRRLARLEGRERELASGHVALCFGSRKLFRAQFQLAENGYKSREEWLSDWHHARSNAFYLLGSKDETGGNQSCTASIADNGTLTLRLRLPDALVRNGIKYLLLRDIHFAYGHDVILAVLEEKRAISYRFLRDDKGWRILASTHRPDRRQDFSPIAGVVAVDLNVDHLAVGETDRFGNLIHRFSEPCVTYGKTAERRTDIARNATKKVVDYAKKVGKPIVHEALDFGERKKELSFNDGPRRARMLSSFAYSGVIQALENRALREGVPVRAVNPAYTSVIGRIKYAKRYGVSPHHAAALVIGRRGMGFGEHAPARSVVPDSKGDHFIFELPARNRAKHEWSHWANVRTQLQATLAGCHRLRRLAALEVSRTARAAQDTSRGHADDGAVRLGPANRQHNRSAGVDTKVRAPAA